MGVRWYRRERGRWASGPIALEALHPEVERAGVSGVVRSAKLALRGAGGGVAQIKRSLEGELDLGVVDAQWRRENKGPATRIKIEAAQLAATRDALRGAFTAAIDDATVVFKLESERAAIESGARVVESAFDASVRRARHRGQHFVAHGALALGPEAWHVEVKEARLGRTRGRATVKGAWAGTTPLALSAAFSHFDTAALGFFDFESVRRRAKPVPWEHTPVLPRELRLPAADFELSAGRFEAGSIRFDAVRLAGRSRAGRLEPTRFELKAKGGALKGELSADLRGKVPELRASVAATDFDLRDLLARFEIKTDRAAARQLEAKLDLRGARLGEALAQSTLQVSAQGLDVAAPGPLAERRKLAFDGKLDVGSNKGLLSVSADGRLNGKAFRVTSRGPQLATLIARAEHVPVDVDLSIAGSTLAVHGTLAKGPAADVGIRLEAKRVDELLALGGLETTARGALTASTQLKLTPPARYALNELDIRLGESALSGHVVADWSAARPAIEATLAGPVLRLRDLGFDASDGKPKPGAVPKAEAQPSAAPGWVAPLRSVDATVDLRVERMYAAGEALGSMQLAARLKDGYLKLAPWTFTEGESRLRGEAEVDATGATPSYALRAELRDYDVTPLLRSFDPRSKGSATFDARAALRSSGTGAAAIANLSGVLDVASYAVGVGSGAIALMGVNLTGLVLRTLDQSQASKINCVVGVFDIDKGIMRSRALFLDTTRLRIMGNLDVDLAARSLDGGLRPRPKNPRLFSVTTPVNISGTFDAPKVSPSTSALPELIIRYSNPYTIFLGSLMDTESAKADGSDDCRAAYARSEAARPELGDELRKLFRLRP